MPKCRDCKHPYIPQSEKKHEQQSANYMASVGYRMCGGVVKPEDKARWITGGCECFVPHLFVDKSAG